eukprot:6502538-Lingulodinium_polyedra.AAC.1
MAEARHGTWGGVGRLWRNWHEGGNPTAAVVWPMADWAQITDPSTPRGPRNGAGNGPGRPRGRSISFRQAGPGAKTWK